MLDALIQPDVNISSGLATLGTAAPGLALVSWIDRGLSALVFLLAAIGFVRRPWTRRTGLPLLVISPLLILAANAYGGEMIFRAYLFALPAAAFLIAALLVYRGTRPRPRMLVIYPLLLALLGGLVFGYYGKEAVNRFTLQEVAAARYVTSHAPKGSRIVTLTSAVPGLFMHYDQHEEVLLGQQDIGDRRRLVRDPVEGVKGFVYGATAKEPAYIILSQAQARDLYLTGELPADTVKRLESALSGAAGFARVYDSDDAVVYRYETPRRRSADDVATLGTRRVRLAGARGYRGVGRDSVAGCRHRRLSARVSGTRGRGTRTSGGVARQRPGRRSRGRRAQRGAQPVAVGTRGGGVLPHRHVQRQASPAGTRRPHLRPRTHAATRWQAD